MQRKHWIWFALAVMVVVAACAPQETPPAAVTAPAVVEEPAEPAAATTVPVDPTVTPAQEEAQQPPAVTEAIDVEALILEKLNGCHTIARVLGASKTREQWEVTLDRMIGKGAKINEEEKQIIIDYLLSR
ncbi:MAG: hypothetical protein U1B80_10215 [Anaerolineaceae bacterium]|nr:hypothetical protein [Anaerolineaceae bacterium]